MAKPIDECKADARFLGVATIKASGEDLSIAFRRPSAREWMDYEATRTSYQVALQSGRASAANMREMYDASSELVTRIAISHGPEELEALNERHLGIYFEVAADMAEQIDKLRAGAGKASPPRGGA